MWNEKKLMEWNGNGMKVVENLWNGMEWSGIVMEWKWNDDFQDFGSLLHILHIKIKDIIILKT
jgi:hypothetical protein